jgi:general secretion pathway protein G
MDLIRKRRGFTLIEIMVVVIVLAILAAVIIPNFASKPEEARVSKAKGDISTLETLLEQFRLNLGRYPAEEEGLAVLRVPPQSSDADRWKGPYATKDIPKDPWGHDYHYYSPCPNGIDGYGIESFGRDNQPGGQEFDADIQSWSTPEEKQ